MRVKRIMFFILNTILSSIITPDVIYRIPKSLNKNGFSSEIQDCGYGKQMNIASNKELIINIHNSDLSEYELSKVYLF